MSNSKLSIHVAVIIDLFKYFFRSRRLFIVSGIITITYFASVFGLLIYGGLEDSDSALEPVVAILSLPLLVLFGGTLMLGGIGGVIAFIVEVIFLWIVVYKFLEWLRKKFAKLSKTSKRALYVVGIGLYAAWVFVVATVLVG